MEKQPRFPICLGDIGLRRVAAMVWTEADVLASFEKLPFKVFPNAKREEHWRQPVENKVRDKVSKLPLPFHLVPKLMPLVRPIGAELLRWKLFNEKFLGMWREDFDADVYRHLYWTAMGSIDYQKTALELIRFGKLDLLKRYKLASLYCLESHIKAIWDEFPESSRRFFYKQDNPLLAREPQMEFCWAYTLREEESQPDYVPENRFANPSDFHLRAFQFSAAKGNKAAAEYFFQKLTPQERKASLMKTVLAVLENRNGETDRSSCCFPTEKLADVFCYLFFVMTPEQQIKICKRRLFGVLRCFLEWPWQDIVSTVTDLFLDFSPQRSYENLLDIITYGQRHLEDYFAIVFRQFFPLSPVEFRKQFVHREYQSGFMFPEICCYDDKETAEIIFRNVDFEDQIQLLSSYRFCQHLNHLSPTDSSDFYEMCIRGASLSKKDAQKLKKTYKQFINTYGAKYREHLYWTRIVHGLDTDCPPVQCRPRQWWT